MDWVHCNQCGIQPTEGRRRAFLLTSCGHIFCQCCEKEGGISECKVCQNKDVTTIRLSSDMKPDIQVYFQDPQDLASQVLKTMEFQKGQRMRFLHILQKKVAKYDLAKMQIAKLDECLKKERQIKKELIEHQKMLMSELEKQKRVKENENPTDSSINLNGPLLAKNSRISQLIKSSADSTHGTPDSRASRVSQNLVSPYFCSPPGNYRNYRNSSLPCTPIYGPISPYSLAPSTPMSSCSIRSDDLVATIHPRQCTQHSTMQTPPMRRLTLATNNSRESERF